MDNLSSLYKKREEIGEKIKILEELKKEFHPGWYIEYRGESVCNKDRYSAIIWIPDFEKYQENIGWHRSLKPFTSEIARLFFTEGEKGSVQ